MESRVWEEAYTDFGAKRKEIEDWNLAHSGCCSWARFSGECVPGICRCLLTSPVFWSGPLWLCHPGSSSGMFFVRPLKWWNHIPNSEIELKERFGLAVFLPFPFQYLILSCLSSRTHMAFLLPRGWSPDSTVRHWDFPTLTAYSSPVWSFQTSQMADLPPRRALFTFSCHHTLTLAMILHSTVSGLPFPDHPIYSVYSFSEPQYGECIPCF